MKDYKLLLAGLILLLLIILLGIFTWLWNNNRKNIDPLPIMASTDAKAKTSSDIEDNSNNKDAITTSILYVQAENQLQVPLDDVIIRFESRYPNIQILARYVPTPSLLTLPNTQVTDSSMTDNDNLAKKAAPSIVNIDMIIADDRLTQNRLTPLQTLLNDAQAEINQNKINVNGIAQDNSDNLTENSTTKTNHNEARILTSFSYAIKGAQTVEGVILTDNPFAVSFRNFLLSSAGQDILKQYDYDNIDGYKNSMDDLFNPTSRAKTATGQPSVKVADALNSAE